MRTLILGCCVALAAAVPARAQTQAQIITPADAKARVGQTVTVQGGVSNVHTGRSGTTFIDLGGRYPDNSFTAVIFVGDLRKFPDLKRLGGRSVAIKGPIQLYQGRPEIILRSTDQLTAK